MKNESGGEILHNVTGTKVTHQMTPVGNNVKRKGKTV
jgi:hypothetical protein